MKLILKIFLILFSTIILICLFFYFGVYLHYTKQELQSITYEIRSTNIPSNEFTGIYDKLCDDRLQLLSNFYDRKKFLISNHQYIGNRRTFDLRVAELINQKNPKSTLAVLCLTFWLGRTLGPKICFNYFQNRNYHNYIKQFPTSVTINKLNDTTEILRFIIASKALSVFSKKPEMLEKRLNELKNDLKN